MNTNRMSAFVTPTIWWSLISVTVYSPSTTSPESFEFCAQSCPHAVYNSTVIVMRHQNLVRVYPRGLRGVIDLIQQVMGPSVLSSQWTVREYVAALEEVGERNHCLR